MELPPSPDGYGEAGFLSYPVELTHELLEILGLLPGDILALGHRLQSRGRSVPARPGPQAAWVKHWLVCLYLRHGGHWRAVAGQELGGTGLLDGARSRAAGEARRPR